MRAAWYDRKGPPNDVLKVGEMPDPSPGPGEVRVRVRVSAVNPSDTKTRQGWGRAGRHALPARHPAQRRRGRG